MRNKSYRTLVAVVALVSALCWTFALASDGPDKSKTGQKSLEKGAANTRYGVIDINNVTSWLRNDGQSNHSPGGDNGMYYPRGTGNVIYQDGVVFAGKMFVGGFPGAGGTAAALQPIRVGGGTYGVGTKQGWITGQGATAVAVNPNDARARVYRVRRDYASMSPTEATSDAASTNEKLTTEVTDAMIADLTAQYDTDWKNWPTDLGAPYIDRNKNGRYDAPPAFSATFTVDSLIAQNRDEPGIAGADPNSPADQVVWTVYNDYDKTQALGFEGSEPFGLEIQKTVWGYKRTDALGNLYFSRYRMINKGGIDIGGGTKGAWYVDSMYVCQWSDPDLGSFSDDIAGCDSVLSIGFIYNANGVDDTFKKYGIAPPSSAYDFLAGPVVVSPADSAVFDLKRKKGFKNLGMSSFAYFSAGSPYSDPPGGSANYTTGTGRWWKMLRGFAPLGTISDADQPYATPPGLAPTKFPLSGDPVARTGFLDGAGQTYSFAPGDRRILLTTGPFRMAPGDTQDITIGVVAGLGADRLSSVAVMKFNDKFVQNTYDALFQVPKPPLAPNVKIAELDRQLVMEWASDAQRVIDVETRVAQPGAYRFEGYNVYQLPTRGSRLSEGIRISTFDTPADPTVVLDQQFDGKSGQILALPVQFGSNSGIQRFLNLKRDYVRDIDKLYNGQEYYYVVTAYSVATVPGYLPAALESDAIVLTARPRVPFGKQLMSAYGDTIQASHTGPSDGAATASIMDPSALNGSIYRISFSAAGTWTLTNVTKSTTLFSGQTNQTANILSPMAEGIQWKVIGAPNDAKDFLHVAGPTGAINPPSYASFSTFNSWGFPDPTGGATGGGPSSTDWGGGRWGIHTGGAGSGGDESYEGRFKPRVFRGDNFSRFVPYDFEIRFTAAGGKAYMAFTSGTVVNVPFELWNIGIGTPTNTSDDFRMIPWINDADGNDVFNLNKTDHAVSGGDNDPYTDWIYWMEPNPKTPGSAGYNAFVAAGAGYDADPSIGTGGEVMARVVLVNVNGGSVSDATWPANVTSVMPATGNVIRIISTKPNTASDVFTINTAAKSPQTGSSVTAASASKVGVFPNPYYAYNPAETNRFFKFVTFNNLPTKATFKIFNLAGQLVRQLEKNDNSQFINWDLNNTANFPVASGIYIVYVDMPDIGAKKVLKVAIIQEQEVLDSY